MGALGARLEVVLFHTHRGRWPSSLGEPRFGVNYEQARCWVPTGKPATGPGARLRDIYTPTNPPGHRLMAATRWDVDARDGAERHLSTLDRWARHGTRLVLIKPGRRGSGIRGGKMKGTKEKGEREKRPRRVARESSPSPIEGWPRSAPGGVRQTRSTVGGRP